MRYVYHFEFCERPEMPEWLRGDFFRSLGWLQKSFGLHQVLKKNVAQILEELSVAQVIELGSGSGEALVALSQGVQNREVRFFATDRFPKVGLWERCFSSHKQIEFITSPVSFESVGSGLKSSRELPSQDKGTHIKNLPNAALLLISTLHHADPKQTRLFFEQVAGLKMSIVIVEPLERNIRGALLGLFAGVPSLLVPLFFKGIAVKERLRFFFLHWIIPVVPFVLSHDGLVSALRQRREVEWRELTQGLPYQLHFQDRLGPLRNFSVLTLRYVGDGK
ncbi:MAG: hypothetical protein AB1540_05650 [Bdellovibrionota bacterium]